MKDRVQLEPPEGFLFEPALLGEDEERRLLERCAGLTLSAPVMHGQPARRLTGHFGWVYSFEDFHARPGPPLPEFLVALRARCARFAGLGAEALAEGLVTRYPPGAGIGWHRDAPAFGATVVGVSLGSACRFRMRRERDGGGHDLYVLELPPRSAYVLSGPARAVWQHQIPPVKAERWSITFRTLKRPKPER